MSFNLLNHREEKLLELSAPFKHGSEKKLDIIVSNRIVNIEDTLGQSNGPIMFVQLLPPDDDNTSQLLELTAKASCALESASLTNPQRTIFLFTNGNGITGLFKQVVNQFHIAERRIHFEGVFSGTPLLTWYLSNVTWQISPYKLSHLSDALRYAFVYKYGGIYADTDIIFTKNFDPLPINAIGREDRSYLNGAVLMLQKHHNLLKTIMAQVVHHYKPRAWNTIGPSLITDSIKNICPEAINNTEQYYVCNDIHIVDHMYFYPIHYTQVINLYKEEKKYVKKMMSKLNHSSYTIHLYNKANNSKNDSAFSPNLLNSIYRNFCPLTFRTAQENNVYL